MAAPGHGRAKAYTLLVPAKYSSPASDDAGVILARSVHQLVRTAAGVNDCARVAVKSAQALVTASRVCCPHDRVICAIGGGDPGRTLTVLAHVPRRNYRRRVCGSNSVSGNSAAGSAKNKICALPRAIGGSRLSSNRSSHLRRRNRRSNAAEIASVKQIRLAVFAQCKHQLRRRRAIDSDHHRTTAAKVGVSVVELQPIRGRPVVGRVSAEDRPGLQTNYRFAVAPLASGLECVPCDSQTCSCHRSRLLRGPKSRHHCALVAHAVTVEGLLIGTPTTQP